MESDFILFQWVCSRIHGWSQWRAVRKMMCVLLQHIHVIRGKCLFIYSCFVCIDLVLRLSLRAVSSMRHHSLRWIYPRHPWVVLIGKMYPKLCVTETSEICNSLIIYHFHGDCSFLNLLTPCLSPSCGPAALDCLLKLISHHSFDSFY